MSVNEKMTALANAIRAKTGGTETLTLDQMANDLNAIPERAEIDLAVSGATVTVPAGNYKSQASKSVAIVDQATPDINIEPSGLITTIAEQTAGYVTAGTKSSTYQLAFQPGKFITPSTASQIAVSSGYYIGGNVTVAGDANLVAENIADGVSIFGVTGVYAGNTDAEDEFVTKTVSTYENSRVKTIGRNAFAYCSSLTTVSFPACTTIDDYAFNRCSRLTTVSFPSCTTIGSSAFYACSSLTTVSFPSCTTIGSNAFGYCYSLTTVSFPSCTTIGINAFAYCSSLTTVSFPSCTTIGSSAFIRCTSLTTVSFPSCTTIGSSAFYACTSLTTVSFPSCTTIGSSAFYACTSLTTVSFPSCTTIGINAFAYCSSLTTVSFPSCTTIGSNAFNRCTSLTTVSFPSCTTIDDYAFNRCSRLTTVSFPSCTTIGSNAFYSCTSLTTVYLKNSSICLLSNSNAFSGTGIKSTTGSIYVPHSLVASYQVATNWVYFSNIILGCD